MRLEGGEAVERGEMGIERVIARQVQDVAKQSIVQRSS